MPTNELIPFYESADRLTCQASVAVLGKTFVAISGNRTSGPATPATPSVGASDPTEGGNYQVGPAAAGGTTIGVATWDAAVGEKVGVIREGIVPVTANAAIAAGALVEIVGTGATAGRVQAAATGRVVGICMTGCSGAGVDAEILLLLTNVAV